MILVGYGGPLASIARRQLRPGALCAARSLSTSTRESVVVSISSKGKSSATKAAKQPTTGLPIRAALEQVLKHALDNKRKFNESVDLALRLGVDPRKPNQSVRGVQTLPNGTGKRVRVAVFARGQDAETAKAAGAEVVGADELVAAIQAGNLNFDRCIATPEVMPLVSRVARILGPRGLMPNPKMGTVTKNVAAAVKAAMAGQVQFKADRFGMLHATVGKVSFPVDDLIENIRAFMVAIGNAKPEGAKGKYIKGVHISTTMGIGVEIDPGTVDPRSSRFMFSPTETPAAAEGGGAASA